MKTQTRLDEELAWQHIVGKISINAIHYDEWEYCKFPISEKEKAKLIHTLISAKGRGEIRLALGLNLYYKHDAQVIGEENGIEFYVLKAHEYFSNGKTDWEEVAFVGSREAYRDYQRGVNISYYTNKRLFYIPDNSYNTNHVEGRKFDKIIVSSEHLSKEKLTLLDYLVNLDTFKIKYNQPASRYFESGSPSPIFQYEQAAIVRESPTLVSRVDLPPRRMMAEIEESIRQQLERAADHMYDSMLYGMVGAPEQERNVIFDCIADAEE